MVVLGRCTRCGHTQPGTEADGQVHLFTEDGCVRCGCDRFVVAEEGDYPGLGSAARLSGPPGVTAERR